MAHPGRARVNAISTALPDSQLRLVGREGGRMMRERDVARRREKMETGCLERERKDASKGWCRREDYRV